MQNNSKFQTVFHVGSARWNSSCQLNTRTFNLLDIQQSWEFKKFRVVLYLIAKDRVHLMYKRVFTFYRVCIVFQFGVIVLVSIYTKHEVFVFRVPNSALHGALPEY